MAIHTGLRSCWKGQPDEEGMVFDFVELKKYVSELVLSKLDHAYINDILPQPTAEYIARWIFEILDKPLKRDNCELYEVRVLGNRKLICDLPQGGCLKCVMSRVSWTREILR